MIYQSGAFTHADAVYVWAVLAGSRRRHCSPATMGRLYNSAFYALFDTRTPLRFALIRVVLTLVLGYLCAIPLPHMIGIAQKWGVAGLTVSAGVAGWVEFALLRWALNRAHRMDRARALIPGEVVGAGSGSRRDRHSS